MFWLIFNHVDAWGMSFIIASVSLALRGALTAEALSIPAALAAGAWFAFALNDRFDAPFDAHEPAKARRNAFARAAQAAWRLDLVLLLAGLALALVYVGFGVRGVLTAVVGLAASVAYSGPRLRLKTRPGFDLFTHAAFVETFPYLAAIALAGAPLLPFDLLAWAVLALTSLSAQLEQQARDYGVDSKLERNFTTVVGLQANHRLLGAASLILLVACTAGALTGVIPPLLWPGMALALPMVVHRLIRPPGAPRNETLIRLLLAGGAVYIAVLAIGVMTAG
jgi:4-hydroxybenzoate polyprenyltransferase